MRLRLIMVGALVGATALTACDSTQTGVKPVGGDEVSETEVERFVRRAHLDTLGQTPTDEFVTQKRDELVAAGNTATARGDFVRELLADPSWATATIDELNNRSFAGDGYDFAYAILCDNFRNNDPACSTCQPSSEVCGGCTCASVTELETERAGLESAEADLASGNFTTGEIERRYAQSQAYQFGQAIPIIADNLFQDFLGRPPEGDELANVTALIVGFVAAPGNAAGLLFHRHGSNYDDLIDIIFTSELYRNAAVARVFDRLLGRLALPVELVHFSKDLDADAVDIKDVVTAVMSSGEYFRQ